jgi:hypothetical protein
MDVCDNVDAKLLTNYAMDNKNNEVRAILSLYHLLILSRVIAGNLWKEKGPPLRAAPLPGIDNFQSEASVWPLGFNTGR